MKNAFGESEKQAQNRREKKGIVSDDEIIRPERKIVNQKTGLSCIYNSYGPIETYV